MDSNNSVFIIHGDAGTGKSALVKDFVSKKFSEDKNSVLGRLNNERVRKYISSNYVSHHENLSKWKIFLAKSNGTYPKTSNRKVNVKHDK